MKEKSMKRILIREKKGNTRLDSLKKRLREVQAQVDYIRERTNIITKFLIRYLREGERSETDMEALHDVQTQIDSLIEELMGAKVALAGLSIGGDDVYVNNGAQITRQRNY
jgi:hypothetical protein